MTPNSEPTAYSGVVTAIAIALIPFLRSVGVDISQDTADSGLALLAAIVLGLTFVLRSRVVTTGKAESAIGTALNTAPLPSGTEQQSKAILADTKS